MTPKLLSIYRGGRKIDVDSTREHHEDAYRVQYEHKEDYKSELDYGQERVTERMVLTLSLTIAVAFAK